MSTLGKYFVISHYWIPCTRVLSQLIPAKMWHGKKIDLSGLQGVGDILLISSLLKQLCSLTLVDTLLEIKKLSNQNLQTPDILKVIL